MNAGENDCFGIAERLLHAVVRASSQLFAHFSKSLLDSVFRPEGYEQISF